MVYAIPFGISVDITDEADRNLPVILKSESIAGLKKIILDKINEH